MESKRKQLEKQLHELENIETFYLSLREAAIELGDQQRKYYAQRNGETRYVVNGLMEYIWARLDRHKIIKDASLCLGEEITETDSMRVPYLIQCYFREYPAIVASDA